jgi:HSP20 family protein
MTQRDPRSWMWAEACEFLERAERLQRQFFRLGQAHAPGPAWEPPMDIFETDEELLILVALPGIAANQVQIIFDSGTLTVAGERHVTAQARGATIHRLEIPYGRFERQVRLPSGRFELSRKELVDGCLVLSLRKAF